MRSFLSVAFLVGLGGVLSAQTASYSFFGENCQHPLFPPLPFSVAGLPKLGQTLTVQTDGSWGMSGLMVATIVVTGLSKTRFGALPLPFDTKVLDGPGINWCGSLYCSMEMMLPIPPSGSVPWTAKVPFPIPNDVRLLGLRFYQQIFQYVSSPNHHMFQLSKAGEALIGT